MVPLVYHILLVAATVVTAVAAEGSVQQVGVDVGMVLRQVVEHQFTDCHLVFITTKPHSYVSDGIIRYMTVVGETGIVVEATRSVLSQDHLLQGLWGDIRTTCRALILDLTTSNSSDLVLRLAEVAGLRKRPETPILVVGGRVGVKDVLLHHSLRNTLHALYLALPDLILQTPTRHGNSRLRKVLQQEVRSERVWVYRRCMYCKNGEADVHLIHQYNSTSLPQPTDNLLQEQVQNLMGHKLKIVSVPHFPYMDFDRDVEPGSIIVAKDSIDTRLIHAFAAKLNFTFEHRAEPELTWGLEKNGTFNGMIGQLQREETDFCTIAGPTPERLKVVDYLRGYPSDPMTVTSLKPSLLPQHLSLIRPFEGELWMALLASVVSWGVVMWVLQRVWGWMVAGLHVKFSTALLYGWGALLEQPPPDPSVSDSGRLLVGWWLVFCLVITTGFRSSLIAHMTVQGKTQPIESFEDVLKQDNWRWGTEPWLLKGVPYDYFSKHTDPVVQKIFKHLEKVSAEEGLRKVQAGGYTLIDWENYISIFIASYYTDARGNTPFYISKQGVSIMAAFGWGFRKGAPFYPRFSQLMIQLEDAGIISYWTKEVIARRVRENRGAALLDSHALSGADTTQSGSKEVALGLRHLQGAFYVLFLGLSFAFLTLLGENFARSRSLL